MLPLRTTAAQRCSHVFCRVAVLMAIGVPVAIMVTGLRPAEAQRTKVVPRTPLDARRTLGTPQTFRNLTLVPVYDAAARSTDAYLTLDEGLKTKQISVRESKEGGDVNTLYITNRSRKPLYLMAGEVVLGGQQDRCLGKDRLIPPGQRGVPISVYCVEHGRWAGRPEFDASAGMVASADIRGAAQEGTFAASRPAGSPMAAGGAMAGRTVTRAQVPEAQAEVAARMGVAQQKVWDKVAEKNRRFKAAPATGTYREVLGMAGGEARASVTPYVRALSARIAIDPHLVGMVAAVNGRVTAADIFGDPTLFRKLWPKLLRSYAADAAEHAAGKRTPATAATQESAKRFLLQAAVGHAKSVERSSTATSLRLETKSAVLYRLAAPGKRDEGVVGGGLAGSALHENVLHK